MHQATPAKLLRIHISESDTYAGRPLHEEILARCRGLQVAGATVFRGLEGFGESAEVHRAHLLRHDRPIVIVIVDSPGKIEALTPVVEQLMNTGMIAISDVTMLRVQKSADDPQVSGPA